MFSYQALPTLNINVKYQYATRLRCSPPTADFDGRLWVRDYRLPDQDSVTWRVWDIDRQELLFTARMGGEDRLLDARGDVVLLRRLDEFDVPAP